MSHSEPRFRPLLALLQKHFREERCVFRARKASDSRQGGPWFHAMSVHCS